MALPARVLFFLFHTFVWSLIGGFRVSYGTLTDISCLKSIKESLEDPYGYLNYSWNFNNNTEGFICKFTGVECWHPYENKVLNIRLSDMGLKGQFPRGIEKCKSLTGLDLSSNKLWGPLPSDIAKRLKYVTTLDLSSNNFSGEIPSSIADCSYINVLRLDNNRLMGRVPQELGRLSRIKIFSVANNLLSGPVPDFGENSTITVDDYANNMGLCGPPLKPCKKHRNRMKFDDSFQGGFVVGYAVSVVSVITVFMSYCVPWVQVKKKSKITMTPMMTALMKTKSKKRKEVDKGGQLPSVKHLREWSQETSELENLVTRMSFSDLSNATENFSQYNVIGLGKMGTTYKATLSNGWFLAIKRLYDSQYFHEQFKSELKTVGRLRHENLVPLLGFCIESNERLVVYKYMPNGNLYDWLHPIDSHSKIMEWPLRVKIAIGVARGLAWLHHSCNFRIVHLDISSKCILLDQNFEPKLSNFGEAILMNPNMTNSTLSFYSNSEFWESGIVKEDVRSFGIVLLELIMEEDPSKMANSSDSDDGALNDWINHLSNSSSGFYDAIDKSLIGQGFDGEIFQFLKVACNCVHPFPDQRPTMLEVFKKLSVVGETYGLSNGSETLKQSEIVTASTSDDCIEVEMA